VVIGRGQQNVVWTNVSGTIQVGGNNLTKVSGTTSWYDAGAVSTQTIAAGDGYVEFTPGQTTTWRMCGLGKGDTGAYFDDIEYAFFMDGGANLAVYESGTYRGNFGPYAASDRLRVAVEGGIVKYYRNGVLLYTSTVAPQYPLLVDTSLNTVWSYISNVVISTVPVPNPVRYVLQDIQGSTRAVMSGSAIVARHDYLPFGEEIGETTGMRTTAQGFGAADKIRQRYALTERDDSSGLDHTSWRKYENTAGRWTSPDPYGGSMTIANPQSFNRYAYTQNDPVNFVDPSGLNLAAPGGGGGGYCFFISQLIDDRWTLVGVHCMDTGGGSGGGEPGGGGGRDTPPEPAPTQQGQQHCGNVANLAPANTDQGALARLIFQEATGSSRIGFGQNQADEVNAISAVVQNRQAFLNIAGLTQSQTRGFGNVGASIADVVHSRGNNPSGRSPIGTQFAGFTPGGIAQGIQNRLNRALASRVDSNECFDLLSAVIAAGSYQDPFGNSGGTFGMRTANSGPPGGAFVSFPQIPGSGNVFFGLRR